jgi:hypothetical protein
MTLLGNVSRHQPLPTNADQPVASSAYITETIKIEDFTIKKCVVSKSYWNPTRLVIILQTFRPPCDIFAKLRRHGVTITMVGDGSASRWQSCINALCDRNHHRSARSPALGDVACSPTGNRPSTKRVPSTSLPFLRYNHLVIILD